MPCVMERGLSQPPISTSDTILVTDTGLVEPASIIQAAWLSNRDRTCLVVSSNGLPRLQHQVQCAWQKVPLHPVAPSATRTASGAAALASRSLILP
jgi:hypothetical protein